MGKTSWDWGNGYCGAVSLTFDDGRATQLDIAVPAMDERHLRGSFYISNPINGDDWTEKIAPWQAIARNGHEIGNHSLRHFAPDNILGRAGGLEELTPEEAEADILAAQKRLEKVAPHQKQWTYAYPCSHTFLGRGRDRKSYVPIIAKHFLCGRTVSEFGLGNVPAVVDLACVWSQQVDRMSGFEMIGMIEQLTGKGQWVILCLHEIDGPRLMISSYDFEQVLDFLVARRETIWTAPVVEVAAKVAQGQAAAKR
jgi:peptidoglycan-N-acetylglucosamine deacetylase